MLFDQNTRIRTHEGVFTNSRCLFVEYLDVIQAPYFIQALDIWQNKEIEEKEPYSFTSLRACENESSVAVWYYLRRNQNLLYSLVDPALIGKVDYAVIEKEEDEVLKTHSVYVENAIPLNFKDVIDRSAGGDNLLVPDVRIWYPFNNPVIEEQINTLFPQDHIKPIFGDLMEILSSEEIPRDTTYIFSNWDYLETLCTTNRLNCSSVLLAKEYLYNYNDDYEPYHDIDQLADEYTAHIAVFAASVT